MLRFLALLGILSALLTGPVLAAPAKPRVLYLSQSVGWRHAPVIRLDGDLSPSEIALADLARTSGAFTLETTQDAREITAERLRGVDVLMFYTTGALPITPGNWQAIQDWVASGKGGFVGLHSAADTGWPYDGPGQTFTRFVGGKFAGHPWTEGTPITVAAVAPHATTAAWPPRFAFAEEIYQYAEFDPASTRVLQTLDFTGTPLKRPYLVPVSWVKAVGQGRLVFTNLGHAPTTFQEPRFQAQVVRDWCAGRQATAEATPRPTPTSRRFGRSAHFWPTTVARRSRSRRAFGVWRGRTAPGATPWPTGSPPCSRCIRPSPTAIAPGSKLSIARSFLRSWRDPAAEPSGLALGRCAGASGRPGRGTRSGSCHSPAPARAGPASASRPTRGPRG